MPRPIILLALSSCLTVLALPQTPSSQPAGPRGVIRLRVKLKVGETQKGLSRKRFFLIRGSLEDNKGLIQNVEQQSILSRECFYRSLHVSDALIRWLKENDCESVYCREIEEKDVAGAQAVPEFQQAVNAGEKEFGTRDLARKWLVVNLPDEIRNGFYKQQQRALQATITQAESVSKAPLWSAMTDRNGTAYFTDLEPGPYVVSNLLPTEFGEASELWSCEVTVKPGDLATEKPFLISNRKDRNVKCVAIEKPLPACRAVP